MKVLAQVKPHSSFQLKIDFKKMTSSKHVEEKRKLTNMYFQEAPLFSE